MRPFKPRPGARFFCAAPFLFLLALFPPDLAGQGTTGGGGRQAQDAEDVVRVSAELAQAGVTVLDREGRPVEGLRPEQFELRVDGRPAAVSFFERVSGAAAGRNVIIFVDDLHLSAASVEHLRGAVPEFVEGGLRRGDQVAVVSASGQVGFLQQFTDNRSVTRAAAGRLTYQPPAAGDAGSPPMTEHVALRIARGDRGALDYYTNELLRSLQFTYALPKYGGKGPGFMVGSESDQAARVVMQRAEAILARASARTSASLASLEDFLRSSARLPGRKLVLFVSEGFFVHGGAAERVRQLSGAAAGAGAVIYALDARSFAPQAVDSRMRLDSLGRYDKFSGDEMAESRSALEALAESTGGRALFGADRLAAAGAEALGEAFNYYLLAWRPEGGRPRAEKLRHVTVNIAGRPDLRARVSLGCPGADVGCLAQSATEASGREERGATPAGAERGGPQSIVEAASKNFAGGALPTRLAVSYLDTPGNGAVLTASTQVTVEPLAHGADGRSPAAVGLAGVVFDDTGKSVSSFKTRLSVEPTGAPGGPSSVIYNYRAALKPGLYQVRVAALDERGGRAGRALEWVEIPDLSAGRLTLSSLMLGGEVVAADRPGAAPPADAPQMQFSVDRRFRRGSRLSLMLFVYNAGRAAPPSALTAEIRVTRGGRPALDIPRQTVSVEGVEDPRRIPYGGSFPLKSLAPGRYELAVTITDSATRQSATRQVEFDVE
ncbi:MAG TPA: VWA domain-containing protein [Pyrinomonadaceae bacterium]|nr:VWA domain-containing protein [Pyrinomonadaceae bacterium]